MSSQDPIDDVIKVGAVREPGFSNGATRPRRTGKVKRTIASRRVVQHRRWRSS